MDTRSSLILKLAKEMFENEHPGGVWPNPNDKADTVAIKCQGKYLSRAEHPTAYRGSNR
jgi:hypothetical protein